MALDNAVLQLTAQPPKLEDPIAAYQKLMGVKAAQQQQILTQQQIEGVQLENQQKQIQAHQAQAVNDAYSQSFHVDPTTGQASFDMDKMTSHLAQSGAGGAIPGVVSAFNSAQKAKSELQEQSIKTAQLQADYAASHVQAAQASGYNPTVVLAGLQDTFAATKDPKIQQAIQALQQNPTAETAKAIVDPIVAASPAIQESLNKKKTADAAVTTAQSKATAEAREQGIADLKKPVLQAEAAQATTGQVVKQLAGATSLADYNAKVAALPPDQQALAPKLASWQGAESQRQILRAGLTADQQVTTAQKDQEIAQGAKRVGIEQAGLGIRRQELGVQMYNAGLDASGQPIKYTDPATGQPANVSPIAQAIANYKLPPAAARSYSTNRGLMNQVLAANPKFDIAEYETRQGVTKDFANDKPNSAGGQVLALNTLVHHADLYQEVASSLKNGTFVPGNAVYNSVAQAFGKAPPTNVNLVGQFLAGETAKAAGGSQAEGEITRILGSLNKNASPDQIKQAGDTILQIASGRMIPLREKADAAKLGDVVKIVGPDASAILQKNGYDPNTLKKSTAGGAPVSGGGNYANTATGPGGHKIGTNDGGKTWFDVQSGKKVQ